MYLDEDSSLRTSNGRREEDENKVTHRDSNGVILEVGDSVVLIKDLSKRLEYSAKQGTAVRNIRLDHDNAEFIEGKVDGQTIVIITICEEQVCSLSLQCLNGKVLSLDLQY
jgi:protein PhnA